MWRRSPNQVALVVDDVHEIPPGRRRPPCSRASSGRCRRTGTSCWPAGGRHRCRWPASTSRAGGPPRRGRPGLHRRRGGRVRRAAGRAGRRVGGLRRVAGPGRAGSHRRSRRHLRLRGRGGSGGLRGRPRAQLALLAHLGPFDADLARPPWAPTSTSSRLLAGVPLVARGSDGTCTLHGLWRSLAGAGGDPGGGGRRPAPAGPRLTRPGTTRRRGPPAPRPGRGQRRRTCRPPARRRLRSSAPTPHTDLGNHDDDDSRPRDLGEAIVDALGAARIRRGPRRAGRLVLPAPAHRDASPSGRLLAAVAAGEADPDGAAPAARRGRHRLPRRRPPHRRARLPRAARTARVVVRDAERLAALVARVFELEAEGAPQAVPLACLGRALVFDVQNDSRGRRWPSSTAIPPGSLNDVWQGVVSWLRSTSSHAPRRRPAPRGRPRSEALATPGRCTQPLAEGARLQALWFLGEVDAVAAALPALVERMRRRGYRNYTSLAAAQCSLVHALSASRSAPPSTSPRPGRRRLRPAPLVDTDLAIAAAALAVARRRRGRGGRPRRPPRPPAAGRGPLRRPPAAQPGALLRAGCRATRPVWDARRAGPGVRRRPRPGPRRRRGRGTAPPSPADRPPARRPGSSGPTCPCAGRRSSVVAARRRP